MSDELVYEGWVATFTPQAWINDYSMQIDASGDCSWTVNPGYLRSLVDHYAQWYGGDRRKALRKIVEMSTDESDQLKDDPDAPAWIGAHFGPFYCEAEHATFDIDAEGG